MKILTLVNEKIVMSDHENDMRVKFLLSQVIYRHLIVTCKEVKKRISLFQSNKKKN